MSRTKGALNKRKSISEDITGKKYGKLVAINEADNGKYEYNWVFKCECGKIKKIVKHTVLNGYTKSCGCLQKKVLKENRTVHGQWGSKLYWVFRGILNRCNNKKNISYKNYGKRGIKCTWEKFEDFYKDMSVSYNEHVKNHGTKDTQIDRINNNGHYSKKNCHWTTRKLNNLNRRDNVCMRKI